MNYKFLFVSRLFVTVIIAGLVSAVCGVILLFLFTSIGMSNEDGMVQSGWVSSVLFGVLVGYRLNSLVRQSKT